MARTSQRMLAALVAPALLVASGAQGVRYFRCFAGDVSLTRCCASKVSKEAPQHASFRTQPLHCCQTFVLPAADPQAPRAFEPPPLSTAALAVAVAASVDVAVIDPPRPAYEAPSPPRPRPLLHCALLI